MKVVLIQPRINGDHNFPPLGLGYVGTSLVRAGHKVWILDLEIECLTDEALRGQVADFAPDLIGITTTIRTKKSALALARLFQSIPIVFGGSQATLEPEYYLLGLRRLNSFVLRGEAEHSILSLLDYLGGQKKIEDVFGLSYQDAQTGEVVQNRDAVAIKNLDEIPIIDRSLFQLDRYNSRFYLRRCTNIITSRGCPSRCSFCYHDIHGKAYRKRSVENILAEIRALVQQHGYRSFAIYDDNFTLDRKRLFHFCQSVQNENLDIRWRCLSRVSAIDREVLIQMKRAGCREIAFGVESGSDATLLRIKKGITVQQTVDVFDLCREIGVATKAYVMIGFPWETKQDMFQTIRFVDRIQPYFVQFSVLSPLPKTDIYNEIVQMNYSIDAEFDFTRFTPCFETENFTKGDVIKIQKFAERRFKRQQRWKAWRNPLSHYSRFVFRRDLISTVRSLVTKCRQSLC